MLFPAKKDGLLSGKTTREIPHITRLKKKPGRELGKLRKGKNPRWSSMVEMEKSVIRIRMATTHVHQKTRISNISSD